MYEARLQDLLRVSEALPKNKRFSRHSTTSNIIFYIYYFIYKYIHIYYIYRMR